MLSHTIPSCELKALVAAVLCSFISDSIQDFWRRNEHQGDYCRLPLMICWLMFLGRIPEDHGIETTAAPGEKHFRTGTLLCLIHSTNGTTQFAKDARILVCAAHVGSSYHH